jgi:hypothetical protein
MLLSQSEGSYDVSVEIGGMPILLRTREADFRTLLENRYLGFVRRPALRYLFPLTSMWSGRSAPSPVLSLRIHLQYDFSRNGPVVSARDYFSDLPSTDLCP